MDFDSLKKYDLHFPGGWIAGDDRELASKVFLTLTIINSLLVEAVTAFAMFKPAAYKNSVIFFNRSKYESSLPGIYAKAFVYSLNNIEKLLSRLSNEPEAPSDIKKLFGEYKAKFGGLKHIRDSAMHIEDRGRGLDRHQRPLKTHIISLGSIFNGRRFGCTGEDGKQYEIDISEQTLNEVKRIIQKVIDSYEWM